MKRKILAVLLTLSIMSLVGCGKEETITTSLTNDSTESSNKSKVKNTSSSTSESTSSNNLNWDDEENDLKKKSDAQEVLKVYENLDIKKFENDNVSISINGYKYFNIVHFSRSLKYSFGDQTEEGGVVLISVSIQNDSDESVYVGPGLSLKVTGYSSSISRKKELLTEDLGSKLYNTKNEIEAKSKLEGYVALPVKPEAMDKLSEHGEAMLEVPGLFKNRDDFKKENAVIEKQEISIPFSSKGNDKISTASKFYNDKVSSKNMGTKTMIFAKEFNESKTFENINVTLLGYQFTEFAPNEDVAGRFKNFETGVVLLTTEILVKNEGKDPVNLDRTYGSLKIGNSIRTSSENYLRERPEKEILNTDEEGKDYIVFALDKESFEKLYSDQEFALDIKLFDNKHNVISNANDIQFVFKAK